MLAARSTESRTEFTLRDLLYLDFDKAASIWSQFEEGLLKSIDVTEDTGKDRAAGTKFGLKFGVPGLADAQAEANLGVDYIQKRSTLQSKILHHDVLIHDYPRGTYIRNGNKIKLVTKGDGDDVEYEGNIRVGNLDLSLHNRYKGSYGASTFKFHKVEMPVGYGN
jgi:hypothetical protein